MAPHLPARGLFARGAVPLAARCLASLSAVRFFAAAMAAFFARDRPLFWRHGLQAGFAADLAAPSARSRAWISRKMAFVLWSMGIIEPPRVPRSPGFGCAPAGLLPDFIT